MAETPSPQFFRRGQVIIPKGNEVGEVVSIDSPASVQFPKHARRLLNTACKLNGLPSTTPRGLLTRMIEKERVMLVVPTNEEHADAFPVMRSKNQVWANLYELMAAYNMLIPRGFRQRVPVEVRAKSEVGPCLAFLFDQAKTDPVDSRDEVAASKERPRPDGPAEP